MRRVEIDERFAVLLGRHRALATRQGWFQAPTDDAPPLSLRDIAAIENELELTLPDPAIAYIAAGVSCWGDGPVRLGAVLETTLFVRSLMLDANTVAKGDGRSFAVIDDDSNGGYIAVKRGTPAGSDRVFFLEREGVYRSHVPLSLAAELTRVVEERGAPAAPPFVVELTDEPPVAPAPRRVRHPKFGNGHVVVDDGEHVTVAFERSGQKRLKRSFLTFD